MPQGDDRTAQGAVAAARTLTTYVASVARAGPAAVRTTGLHSCYAGVGAGAGAGNVEAEAPAGPEGTSRLESRNCRKARAGLSNERKAQSAFENTSECRAGEGPSNSAGLHVSSSGSDGGSDSEKAHRLGTDTGQACAGMSIATGLGSRSR